MDRRKKPCKNPSRKKIKKSKKKKKKVKGKGSKTNQNQKRNKKKDDKGKQALNWTTAVRQHEEIEEIVIDQKTIQAKGKKKKKKQPRPCKKFPFKMPEEKQDKKKEKKDDKCKKKKKKPIVKGCTSWQTIEILEKPLSLEMCEKKETNKPTITKDDCFKKEPQTLECPGDLIKDKYSRKRRKRDNKKKKKTSARAKPYRAIKTEKTQEATTI